jgi:hypothetical protein
VIILYDHVPNILKNSPRKTILFPDLPTDTAAAVSLARLALEPLAEYSNLFRAVDSKYTFGYEALYLNLHPLQVSLVNIFVSSAALTPPLGILRKWR